MYKIKRGLNIPIKGKPVEEIRSSKPCRTVALCGADYPQIRVDIAVEVGDKVALGDTLFTARHCNDIRFVAPASGVISALNRGHRRAFESLVIELDSDEVSAPISFTLPPITATKLPTREQTVEILLKSGMWQMFLTRPFCRIPEPTEVPDAIFVNAMDTNPLTVNPAFIIDSQKDFFMSGLKLLPTLTTGKVHVVKGAGTELQVPTDKAFHVAEFSGPHPAGLTGTHIHFLESVYGGKMVWSVNYHHIIALGELLETGRLSFERLVALGGPSVKQPGVIKTRSGACLSELTATELYDGEHRVISGSILSGRTANGMRDFLAPQSTQISVLPEGRHREFFGWFSLGLHKHSNMGIYLSSWLQKMQPLAMDTNTHGSPRAMVPIGAYEKVMPLDIMPTQLLRALLVGDLDVAEQLGVLELAEEDLALCTYVCPGKHNFGGVLRNVLERLEKEG